MHLTSLGFETVLANDGEEALGMLAEDSYLDLIITDVRMPYLTGFDLTMKLKQYKETKNIPVRATSAFHDWNKSIACRELAVDGFIPKPVEKEILYSEIKKILGKYIT